MPTHNCDNCRGTFNDEDQGLVTRSRGRVVAAICDDCCDNARKVKLVLSRRDVGGFTYEQFAPIEMIRAAG